MSLTDEIKTYLHGKPKEPETEAPEYQTSELRESWEDFKYEWRKLFSACKWLIIGGSIVLNLLSWSIYESWNGFMGSAEYKQYLLRVSK